MALFCSFVLPTSAITGGSISANDSVTLKDEKLVSTATLEDDFADDRVIVLLSNAASTSLRTYTTADFSEFGCSDVNNLTKYTTELVNAKLRGDNSVAQRAATTAGEQNAIVPQGFHDVNTSEFHQALCLTLEEKGKQNVLDTIAAVIKHPDVIYAGPDYIIHTFATEPNDPYLDEQWAVDKIQLPQAWDTTTGSSTVLVGVVDSGIDRSHPDLYSRVNTAMSRDFTSGYGVPVTSVTDPTGHGTHVAGIIGAVGNNGQGLSGTCFNVTMVSLRVTDEYGDGYSSSVFFAIDYARSKNIPILNISLGWILALDSDYDMALGSVISNYPGLVVCAAGNIKQGNVPLNIDVDYVYPASYSNSNIITVGASDSTDAKRFSSNYGATSVDLFAPGDNILSCYPVAKCQNGTHDTAGTVHYVNGYHYLSGTSMATPYVTGVAALILAKYPLLTTDEVKDRILDTVDPVSALSEYCVTGGRLNAYKAIHDHTFTYSQITARTHRRQCSCGIDVVEPHTWASVGNGNFLCADCRYVSNDQINSVPGEFPQE